MPRRKKSHLKKYAGVFLAVILIVLIAVAVFYYRLNTKQTPASSLNPSISNVPLVVGNTFTYKLKGSTVLGSGDVVTPSEFMQYNNTNYYQVTITGINGTQVSLDTLWQFNNGTQIESAQVIDLSTGRIADTNGFSYVYLSNLNVSALLYPEGANRLIVNSTSTQTFLHSIRTTNCWSEEDQFIDTSDPTGNTMRDDFITVYFDKQTGMLDNLTRIEFFTNPQIELITTWQLDSSNVWAVK
jgi:hypothetical protein